MRRIFSLAASAGVVGLWSAAWAAPQALLVVTNGDVVSLMDVIRTSGATSIGLVTDDKIADAPLTSSGF